MHIPSTGALGSTDLPRHSPEPRSRMMLAPSLLAWAAAALLLLAIAWSYVPFVADDALISLRYSERLLAGEGLTYTDGERVEGYSNLLWVLIVAAGGWLTSDLILVGRVAGSICAVLALGAIVHAAPIASWRAAGPTLAGLATLALSHGLAIWSIGGLEQALQTALLAWTLALVGSGALSASVPLVLLVLTRPDGALFCALVVAGLVGADGPSARTLRHAARLVAIPALTWCAQLGFRLWYYGDWVPNTAYVKLSASAHHTKEGLRYVATSLKTHAPIVVLALIGLISARLGSARSKQPARRFDRLVIVPLVVALGWSAYVVAIGGDIFPGRRHFLPIVVCLAFLVMATWRAWLGRWPWGLQAAVLAVACGTYLVLQRADVDNDRARTERWEWDCEVLASTLREAFAAQRPLVGADSVGCMGYFGKLPTLDLLGLTDRHIARSRPAEFGAGYIGHESGDGRYVLARQPDLLVLCTATGSTHGCFPSSRELSALPGFAAQYRLIPIRNRRLLGAMMVWTRVDSPRIGVTRSEREIRIPGFLFASPGGTIARPSADGRLVALIPTNDVVTLSGVLGETVSASAPGTWTARAIASSPVAVSIDGGTIQIKGGTQQSELREVVLTR